MLEQGLTLVAEKSGKAERIELRVTPHAKALLTAAANARHTTMSEFLLTHGLAAAEEIVATPRVFYASEDGWARVQAMLDEADGAPSDATIQWLLKDSPRD